MSDKTEKVTKGLSDLLITDIFAKHGVNEKSRRDLSPEQKEQVRQLINDLQEQVNTFLHPKKTEQANQAEMKETTAAPSSGPTLTSPQVADLASDPKRKRLVFRKKK